MMVWKLVYTVLYYLIHWAIEAAYRVYQVVNCVVKRLQWSDKRSMVYPPHDFTATDLKRVPRHIGISFAEEPMSFADISNLIVWCMAMGITFISLYDHDGILKKKKHILQEHLQETKSRLLGKAIKPSSEFEVDFAYVNGVTNNQAPLRTKFRINLFSHTDGQPYIAKVAADICQHVKSGTIKPSDIEIDTVTQYLNTGIMNCPDPDLVLQFGGVKSTLGFLPWNLRLTEILLLSSHHNIAYDEFCKLLLRFSACEQRCGQ